MVWVANSWAGRKEPILRSIRRCVLRDVLMEVRRRRSSLDRVLWILSLCDVRLIFYVVDCGVGLVEFLMPDVPDWEVDTGPVVGKECIGLLRWNGRSWDTGFGFVDAIERMCHGQHGSVIRVACWLISGPGCRCGGGGGRRGGGGRGRGRRRGGGRGGRGGRGARRSASLCPAEPHRCSAVFSSEGREDGRKSTISSEDVPRRLV